MRISCSFSYAMTFRSDNPRVHLSLIILAFIDRPWSWLHPIDSTWRVATSILTDLLKIKTTELAISRLEDHFLTSYCGSTSIGPLTRNLLKNILHHVDLSRVINWLIFKCTTDLSSSISLYLQLLFLMTILLIFLLIADKIHTFDLTWNHEWVIRLEGLRIVHFLDILHSFLLLMVHLRLLNLLLLLEVSHPWLHKILVILLCLILMLTLNVLDIPAWVRLA